MDQLLNCRSGGPPLARDPDLSHIAPGCHLCDEMMTVVERVTRGTALTVEVIDISTDAELEARYGLEIPVLMVNGKKAAKYRLSEAELTRILTARTGRSE